MKAQNSRSNIRSYVMVGVILIVLIILPCAFAHLAWGKTVINSFLSFSNITNYKTAYLGYVGSMIGSFVAVFGSLWVQRNINEHKDNETKKKYARIVYFDLFFARSLLTKAHKLADRITIDKKENREIAFYNVISEMKLRIDKNWITDVSDLGGIISNSDIEKIYACYEKLENISDAIRAINKNISGSLNSNNDHRIQKLYELSNEILTQFKMDDSDDIVIVKCLLNKLKAIFE